MTSAEMSIRSHGLKPFVKSLAQRRQVRKEAVEASGLFFQPVDQPGDPIANELGTEIDQQT